MRFRTLPTRPAGAARAIPSLLAIPLLLASALPAAGHPSPGAAYHGDHEKQNGPRNAGQNSRQNGSQNHTTRQNEKIAKYKAMLAKVGPEARAEREAAVEALSALSELAAHAVLQEYVVPGADPDGVRKLVLERLPARLRNENDRVFGPEGSNHVAIRRSYVAPLVKHFPADPSSRPLDANAATRRRLAREALVAMNTKELRETLQRLGVASPATRRQALRAAGQCKNLGLAALIAESLAVKGLRTVAREALYDLTYTDFPDLASFKTWYAENGNARYVDLVEKAARQAKKDLELLETRLRRENISTVERYLDVLAISSLADKWKLIQNQVFPTGSSDSIEATNEMTRACLTRLRAVLADAPPVQRGPDATDRLAFFDHLAKRLDEKPDAVDHALLLEVASYVCAESETAQRTEHQKRLVAGLADASPIVKRGALRGMRRFFTPTNRGEVLAVARDARSAGDLATLNVAVETLRSEGWWAPAQGDADLRPWVEGMYAILTDDKLPVALRKAAISVLCLSDRKGGKLVQSFDLLLAEVGRRGAHVELRQSVMLRLPGLLPNAGPSRDDAAERDLKKLLSLQTDKESLAIRHSAASMLVLPPNLSPAKQKALGTELAQAVGQRLLQEKDERVFGALVAVLVAQASIDGLVATVNTRLRQALEALGGGKKETQNLAAEVVKGLKGFAATKGRMTSEWTAACEALLDQRDRSAIRSILEFHLRDTKGQQLAGERKELQYRVWKLVIRTARLAPDNLSWNDTVNRGEAEMVNEAFRVLIAAGQYGKAATTPDLAKTLDTAKTRLTYLRCLVAVGGKSELLTAQAEAWLQPTDKTLAGDDRAEAQLLLARGYHLQGKPVEAWKDSGMQTVLGALLPARLALQVKIAATMRSQKNLRDAVTLLADAKTRTKPDAPAYWPRLKSYLEARFALDAEASPTLVKELDTWALRAKLTADRKKEVAALRAALQGSAKPPK